MAFPKFIITADGHLRLGMVNQHKELLISGDQCIGGGYYDINHLHQQLVLDGRSYDFGRPKWHLLDALRIPADYRGLSIVYQYNDNFHDDFPVSDKLTITYYG